MLHTKQVLLFGRWTPPLTSRCADGGRFCRYFIRSLSVAVSATRLLLDARLLQVNCTYRFAARDGFTKLHLQECLTANNSETKPDIDVISAPKCASESKDAETCKKSKSENFALTGFLHPMDDRLYISLHCYLCFMFILCIADGVHLALLYSLRGLFSYLVASVCFFLQLQCSVFNVVCEILYLLIPSVL